MGFQFAVGDGFVELEQRVDLLVPWINCKSSREDVNRLQILFVLKQQLSLLEIEFSFVDHTLQLDELFVAGVG